MQTHDFTITVVIPAFNEEKYLARCLQALQKQTYPKNKFDVLVVDNNSTDATAAIAKKFAATIVTEKKQGHVFSLNTGLKKATGDILAVTDADSIPSRDWLTTMANIFTDPRVVGVTGALTTDAKNKTVKKLFKNVHNSFQILHFSLNRPTFYGPNMAIRKEAFKKLKSVDTRYRIGGDAEIGMRLRKYGKVKYSKRLTVMTSARRFNENANDFWKDMSKYMTAYVHAIWLQKPPKASLVPVR